MSTGPVVNGVHWSKLPGNEEKARQWRKAISVKNRKARVKKLTTPPAAAAPKQKLVSQSPPSMPSPSSSEVLEKVSLVTFGYVQRQIETTATQTGLSPRVLGERVVALLREGISRGLLGPQG